MASNAALVDAGARKHPRELHGGKTNDGNGLSKRQRFNVPTMTFQPPQVQMTPTWNVTGHYKVFDRNKIIDTFMGYEVTIFHKTTSQPHQLYARLKLGHLIGLMRFCPHPQTPPNPNDKHGFYLKDFENACNLSAGDVPGPVDSVHCRQKWLMRWRARETGMGLGKRVGGELDINMAFEFVRRPDPGMSFADRLYWVMLYNGTYYQFDAFKQRELTPGDFINLPPDMHWASCDREWRAIFDPRWLQPPAQAMSPKGTLYRAAEHQVQQSAFPQRAQESMPFQGGLQQTGSHKEAQQDMSFQASTQQPRPVQRIWQSTPPQERPQQAGCREATRHGVSLQENTQQVVSKQATPLLSESQQALPEPSRMQPEPQRIHLQQEIRRPSEPRSAASTPKPQKPPQVAPIVYESLVPQPLRHTAPIPWPGIAQPSQQEPQRTTAGSNEIRLAQRKSLMIDLTKDIDEVQAKRTIQNPTGQSQYQSPYVLPISQPSTQSQSPPSSQYRIPYPLLPNRPLPRTFPTHPAPVHRQTPVSQVLQNPQAPPTASSHPKLIQVPGSIPGTSHWTIAPQSFTGRNQPGPVKISSGSEGDIPACRETVIENEVGGQSSDSRHMQVQVSGSIPENSYPTIESTTDNQLGVYEVSSGSEEDIPARREATTESEVVRESSNGSEYAPPTRRVMSRRNIIVESSDSSENFVPPKQSESQPFQSPSPSAQIQSELRTRQSFVSLPLNDQLKGNSSIPSTPSTAVKRKRGRPKGSLKKPKTEPDVDTPQGTPPRATSTMPNSIESGKRGRGRPRKSMETPTSSRSQRSRQLAPTIQEYAADKEKSSPRMEVCAFGELDIDIDAEMDKF